MSYVFRYAVMVYWLGLRDHGVKKNRSKFVICSWRETRCITNPPLSKRVSAQYQNGICGRNGSRRKGPKNVLQSQEMYAPYNVRWNERRVVVNKIWTETNCRTTHTHRTRLDTLPWYRTLTGLATFCGKKPVLFLLTPRRSLYFPDIKETTAYDIW